MKEIDGDLIKLALTGMFDNIGHGCNGFCQFGSGVARQIRETFPGAYDEDLKTEKGDYNKIGNYTVFNHSKVRIFNCYTQFTYGREKVQVDYDALTLCMRKINHNYKGQSIGLPLIGAGLAGGDWNIIKKIIETELKDMDVTIVHYKP